MVTEFRVALAALASALADDEWFVFGAQAVAVWGVPRQTLDIDVTVAIARDDVVGLIDRLTAAGFAARATDAAAFAERYSVIPMAHRSGTFVDIVLADTSFEHAAMARRRKVTLYGVEVPVVSPDDLVVFKLSSDRGKDYDDAAGVIRAQGPDLDADAIREHLHQTEVALDRSDLVSAFDGLLAGALRRHRPS